MLYIKTRVNLEMSIAYAASKKLNLLDFLSDSHSIYKALHRFHLRDAEGKWKQDTVLLLNAAVADADEENRAAPLSYDFDAPDSTRALTLQALHVLKARYEHVVVQNVDNAKFL